MPASAEAGMSATLETRISRALRSILDALPNGADIPRSAEFQEVLVGLEFYLPAVLAEVYGEWRNESLDGILPLVARKTAEREAEIVGHCILISDQTLAPFQLRLQIIPNGDEISWLECRLGEAGAEGMVRMSNDFRATRKRVYAFQQGLAEINWAYQAAFGDRAERQPITTPDIERGEGK
jgi:hypothetical protein